MSSPIRPGQVHRLSSPRPLPPSHDVAENKSSPLRSTPSLLASTFQPPRSSPLASTSSSTSTSRPPPPPSRSFSAPPRPAPPPPPEEVIDVAVERYSSSRRLLDEWEQIALKYKDVKLEDDDEIDIRTGKIVKDRGRLRAMEKVRFFGDDRSEDEDEEEGLVEEDEDDDGLGGWDLKQFESFDQEEEEALEAGAVEEEEPQHPPPPKSYLYFPPPPPPLVVKKHVVDEGDLKEFLEESRRRKELGLDGDAEDESATGSTGSGSGGGWDEEEQGSYDDEEDGEEAGGLEEGDADEEERQTHQNQLTTLNAFDLSDDDPLASSPIPQEKFHRSASLPATSSTFQRPTPPPTISYPPSSSKHNSFLSRSSPISKSPLKNGSSSTLLSPPRVPPPPIDISDSSDDDEEEDEEEEDEEEDDAFVPLEEEEEQEQAVPMEVDSESDSETEPIENDDDNDGDDLNILPSPFKPKSEPVARSVPPSRSRPSPPSPPSSASPPPSFALTTVEEEDSDSSRTRRRSSRTPVPRDFFSSAGYLPAPLHLSSLPSLTRPQQRPPLPKPFSHIPFSRSASVSNSNNAQQPRFASALPTPPLSSTSSSSSSSSIFNPASSSSSSSLIIDLPTTTAGSSSSIRQVRFASPEEEGDMSPIRPSRKPMHRVTAREQLKPLIARIWADELKGRELLDEAKKQEEEGKKRKKDGEEMGGLGKKGKKSGKGKGKEKAAVVGGGFGFFDRPKSWEEDELEEEEEQEEKPVVNKENVWEDGVEVLMVAPWPGTVEKRTREEKKTESKMIVKRRRILSPETVERMEEEEQEREDPHQSTTTATSTSKRRSSLPNFRPTSSSANLPSNFRIASPAQHVASKNVQPKLERPSPAPPSRLDPSSSLLGDSNPSRTSRPSSSLREDVKPTFDSSWKEIEEVFGPAGTKLAKAEKTFLDTPTLMGTIKRTVALLQLRRGTEKWGEEVVREANEEWKSASSSSSTIPSFLRTDPLSLSLEDDSTSLLPSCSNCLLRDRPSHLADVCLGRLLLPVGTQPDLATSSTAPRRTFCSFLDGADRRPWEKVVTSRWKTKEEEVDGEGIVGASATEPWSLDRFIDSLPDEDASPSTSIQRKRSSSARPRHTL
ncbi:hypothetical protein BDY24DRAFT_394752 [Mrakia frigida]|uniref:uncharacterized protein n=1 Tax=Mrakia frigida TaxID=29902 RepID=UPI003FCC12FA